MKQVPKMHEIYEVFLTPENLLNGRRQNSMLGIIALGLTSIILTGGIDLLEQILQECLANFRFANCDHGQ
ncbi:MAG: hypothetical protein ABJA66_00055 [Actinomycetota bacterium]